MGENFTKAKSRINMTSNVSSLLVEIGDDGNDLIVI